MALTQNIAVSRRGPARGDAFGYPIAPGETIYTGGITCVNAAGQAVRPPTSGAVAFAGIATNGWNNSASSAAGPVIVAAGGTWALNVPGATVSNLWAKVYATDDGTLTLTAPTSGFEGAIGYLAGIDNGQTYVALTGH
jgi:hypothetical protein